jgi:hypothetical protein
LSASHKRSGGLDSAAANDGANRAAANASPIKRMLTPLLLKRPYPFEPTAAVARRSSLPQPTRPPWMAVTTALTTT